MRAGKQVTRTFTTVVDKSKPPTSSKPPPLRRSALLSKLRHVGRVHAPEADMRPLLPQRHLLFKSLAAESVRCPASPKRKPPRLRTGLAQLCDDTSKHVRDGNLDGFSNIISQVISVPWKSSDSRLCHAITMNAVLAATGKLSKCTLDDVMSVLTSHGIFDSLSSKSVGAVLDVLVRDKLSQNNVNSALRGELISRALETRLSAGAYAKLITHTSQLGLALSLLHRAVAVSVVPTVSVLNHILELCFQQDDGDRARRVIAEMACRNLQPNIRTLSLLLSRANDLDAVDAVFSVARNNRSLSPDAAAVFLQTYSRVGVYSGDREYIGRCFTIIDWFFDQNIGIHKKPLDDLIIHFASAGQVEAALRAWREMRRAWLGSPSLYSRRVLYASLISRGTARDKHLCQRLLAGLSDRQVAKLNRFVLANTEDERRDAEVLNDGSIIDKATILHRWASTGQIAAVHHWINQAVTNSRGAGIDVRLVLPLLSDIGDTRSSSVKLLLKHFSSGESIYGNEDTVLEQVVQRFWQWMSLTMHDDARGETNSDSVVQYDDNMPVSDENEHTVIESDTEVLTKDDLRASLRKIVRVVPATTQRSPSPVVST